MQRDLENVPINFVEDAVKVRDHRIRRELGLASFISVPSESSARLVRKHLPWGGKIAVIPHGLLRQPLGKTKQRPASSLLRVGCFGNLVHEKGVDLLIEALAGTKKELVLKLSGHCPDPKYREYLQSLAQDLEVRLELKGSYGPDDPHPALDLDLAVFPSLCHETYGLVVEEALAHGVPVVVSSRGALPERAAGM